MKILHEDLCARCPGREKIRGGDKSGKDEDDGSEEAKDVLDAGEGGMHFGLMVPFPGRWETELAQLVGIGAMT